LRFLKAALSDLANSVKIQTLGMDTERMHDHDIEKNTENQEKHSNVESHQLQPQPELQRRLKSRHLQMIAMGKSSPNHKILFSFLLSSF
jgi:amino acid permease